METHKPAFAERVSQYRRQHDQGFWTSDPVLAHWLHDANLQAIIGYVKGRHSSDIDEATAAKWCETWKKEWCNNPDTWIKNRLEFGHEGDESGIRLETTMHVFWIFFGQGAPVGYDDYAEHVRLLKEARSNFLRAATADPIDRTARRMVHSDNQPCPYCNRWFHNPNALVLHLKERHGQELMLV